MTKNIFGFPKKKRERKIKKKNTAKDMGTSGIRMPQVQFGTYKMKGDICHKAVLSAIK